MGGLTHLCQSIQLDSIVHLCVASDLCCVSCIFHWYLADSVQFNVLQKRCIWCFKSCDVKSCR